MRSRRQLGRTGASACQDDMCSCKPNLGVRPLWRMRSCCVIDQGMVQGARDSSGLGRLAAGSAYFA